MKLDLHIHSEYSIDGVMTIAEILDTAEKRGLDAVAVCDHDRLFTEQIPKSRVRIIRGCEFSTEYGHILGLFLQKPIESRDLKTLCSEIHAQGGIAVLAHPYQHKKYAERLQAVLPFIDGIEVINSRAVRKDALANKKAYELAKAHGLCIFAGSDAHTEDEIANAYTVLPDSGDIKKALLENRAKVCGRRASSVCTAKSQLVKIRKSKKRNIFKWFLFLVKCILEDIIHIKEKQYVTYSKDW